MTKLYKVNWSIDIDADSPKEAASMALEIMRDPDSTATVFDVSEPEGASITVDLEPVACWHDGCYLAVVDNNTGRCEVHGLPPEEDNQ